MRKAAKSSWAEMDEEVHEGQGLIRLKRIGSDEYRGATWAWVGYATTRVRVRVRVKHCQGISAAEVPSIDPNPTLLFYLN